MKRIAVAHAERRRRAFGALLFFVGVAIGLSSLTFPYGRDQGLYGYIGREWLHGRMPYETAFDVKTPGIFFVNLLGFAVFGENMLAIRAIELMLAIIPTGVLAAFAATPAGRKPSWTEVGFAVFAMNAMYFGTMDFWNTAQCECWCGVFTLGALTLALRADGPASFRRAAGVGIAVACAVIFKPPCIWLALVPCLVCAVRAWRAPLRWRAGAVSLAGLACGGVIPVTVLLGYFWLRGALDDMVEVYVVMSRFYVVAGRSVHSVRDGLILYAHGTQLFSPFLLPLLALVVFASVRAWRRRDASALERYAVVFAGVLGTSMMVVSQLKFFAYHWGALPGVLTFAASSLLSDAGRSMSPTLRERVPIAATLSLTVALLSFGVRGGHALLVGRRVVYAQIKNDPASVDDLFVIPWFYSWPETKEVARYVAEISRPEDLIAVRGFEPQMYIEAHRRYAGRFFWTTFLTDRRYHPEPEKLLREDWKAFVAAPPRFVVLPPSSTEAVLDVANYERLGYVRRRAFQHYLVLERGPRLDFSTEAW